MGRSHDIEYRMVRADGSIVWVYDAVTLDVEDGRVVRIYGLFVDVSRRVKALRELEAREALLGALAMSVPAGIYVVDLETAEIRYANDRFFEIWGLPCDGEGRPRTSDDFAEYAKTLVADPDQFHDFCAALSESDHPDASDDELLMRDGRVIYRYAAPVADSGTPHGRLYLFQDVTEARRTQESLAEWKLRYEAAAQVGGHIVYEWVPETGAVKFSGSLESTLGWSREELESNPAAWVEKVHPEDRDAFLKALGAVEAGAGECQVEYRIEHKDGSYRNVEGRGRTLFHADGSVARSVGIVADLTESKRAEEERRQIDQQRQQAQRLESLGILAGGIAHDFNNILTAITGNTGLVAATLPDDSPERDKLERVLQSAGRARDLVRNILTYSRQTRPEMRVIDPVAVVEEAIALVRPAVAETVELHVEMDAGGLAIRADESQIHSVAVNLITNARQALGESGGRIAVRLKACESSGDGEPGSEEVVLSVRDDGPGMTDHVKAHIFEPFFTTKDAGDGAGLGMAVTHGIVTEHGGRIEVDSELGHGTEFRVFLPAADERPDEIPQPARTATAPGRLRILAVDDQANVLEVVAGMLEQLGHTIVAVGHPSDALDTFRQDPRAFDLVMTDLSMPSCGGMEFAAEIQRTRANMPVILFTGFDPHIPAEELRAAGVRYVLSKPFRAGELADALGEALDDRNVA